MKVSKKAVGFAIGIAGIMAMYLIPLSLADQAGREREAAYWTQAMTHLDDKPAQR